MKPKPSEHNTDPQYCTDLVDSIDMRRYEVARAIGINRRTLTRYMSGERKMPYPVQFALECLVLEP